MGPHRTKFNVKNSRDKPHVVVIEPWADDFTLMPGEELEVVVSGKSTLPWFSIVEWPGTSQVYCNDTDDFAAFQAGIPLNCGHNRQPDPTK